MPRYLRWIAAITAGVTVQFAFFIGVGAIAVGTGNTEPGQGVGVLVTFGSFLSSVLPTLGVNDWLAKRYPIIAGTDDVAVEADAFRSSNAQSPRDSK